MLRWLPENISTFGGDIDSIMYLIYYVVGAWLILAEGVLLWFLWHYRRKPGRKASPQSGSTRTALAWVVIPACAVLACDIAIDARGNEAWKTIKLDIPKTGDSLVRIEAQQFAWNFRHAGPDGKLDTPDDVVTNGQLHVPVDRIVRFELVSKDVLHSFWVPNLRLKQDSVRGRTIVGWFSATKVGQYGIGCAELCGTGHGVMQGTLIVQNQVDYDTFIQNK
jgi:cytochrome c oxidase subunit II